MAAAKQASAEAKVHAAADAERRIEDSKSELARVKDQLASVLDYKQRKEVLEEEVAKLNADMTKLRSDTAQQVVLGQLTMLSRLKTCRVACQTSPLLPIRCQPILCNFIISTVASKAVHVSGHTVAHTANWALATGSFLQLSSNKSNFPASFAAHDADQWQPLTVPSSTHRHHCRAVCSND